MFQDQGNLCICRAGSVVSSSIYEARIKGNRLLGPKTGLGARRMRGFCSARLIRPNAALNGTHRSVEPRCQFAQAALPLSVSAGNCLSHPWAKKRLWWATNVLSLRAGIPHAGFHAFHDQRSLKLSNRTEHGPGRRG